MLPCFMWTRQPCHRGHRWSGNPKAGSSSLPGWARPHPLSCFSLIFAELACLGSNCHSLGKYHRILLEIWICGLTVSRGDIPRLQSLCLTREDCSCEHLIRIEVMERLKAQNVPSAWQQCSVEGYCTCKCLRGRDWAPRLGRHPRAMVVNECCVVITVAVGPPTSHVNQTRAAAAQTLL